MLLMLAGVMGPWRSRLLGFTIPSFQLHLVYLREGQKMSKDLGTKATNSRVGGVHFILDAWHGFINGMGLKRGRRCKLPCRRSILSYSECFNGAESTEPNDSEPLSIQAPGGTNPRAEKGLPSSRCFAHWAALDR